MNASREFQGSLYHPVTREYMAAIRLYIAPDGTCSLPDNVVMLEPPGAAPPNQAFVLTKQGDAWALCPDFRKVQLWDTSTVMPAPNTLLLGELLPDKLTMLAPLPVPAGERKRNEWDTASKTWTLVDVPSVVPEIVEIRGEDTPQGGTSSDQHE